MKVTFMNEGSVPEVDLLILCEGCRVDKELEKMVVFNRKKGLKQITTNGVYPVPQIALAKKNEPLAPLATQSKVAVLGAPEEAIFQLLIKKPHLQLTVLCHDPLKREEAFKHEAHLLAAILHAKELIAAPANLLPPDAFAQKCRKLQGVEVKILDEKALKDIGAGALLAVGQGSIHPPRLAIITYKGAEMPPITLVGKGICFDAGGIHLKTSHLTEMKWDKAGAGVVYGVLEACARMQLPVHVVGILALAENMPDGAALKPGDVIVTLSGKSVEVIDTDCEGRLVLADALSYAQLFRPRAIIDLSTLTLETFGALGGEYGGLFCTDKALCQQLISAGEEVGEPLWPLPLGRSFAEQLRSEIADLKNVGVPRYGASSVAAEFLRAFLDPQTPYAHIDISGVSWKLNHPEGGVTGFGVHLLVNYLKNFVNS